MKNILAVDGLTKKFGDFTAVNNISFSVEAGEVFGIVGPNGAGKTTTLKMLTTLLPQSAGVASVAGYDVRRQAASVRHCIGYVPQLLAADGSLTGYENLLLFAKLYDIPRKERNERIRQALHFMGLEEFAGRMARSYSAV